MYRKLTDYSLLEYQMNITMPQDNNITLYNLQLKYYITNIPEVKISKILN